MTVTDPRFRVVRHEISGGGLAGTVESFARVPPIEQPGITDLGRHVAANEFSGATAMGTWRAPAALGEVTAKLLAVAGARVILTYASGQAEAERIRQEICSWGGSCDVVRYDVQAPAAQQLAQLAQAPTHLYYFATPPIFQQKSGFSARDRFVRFFDFYVDGIL